MVQYQIPTIYENARRLWIGSRMGATEVQTRRAGRRARRWTDTLTQTSQYINIYKRNLKTIFLLKRVIVDGDRRRW
jgi:hypothetical protein